MRLLACAVGLMLAGCGRFAGPLSPLITAARSGDTTEIKRLVAAGADLNQPGGVNNWTPLMHAIHKNQAAAVSVLLDAGANVNAVSGNTTALIMAAGYGQADIVRILLNYGADPQVEALVAAVGGTRDIDNYTAGKCQTETVKALLGKDPGLRLGTDVEAVKIAQSGGCAEVVALVAR